MNLVNETWIPVSSQGKIKFYSLRDLFAQSITLKGEIRCPTPIEDAAIHRLLFAIAIKVVQPKSSQEIDQHLANPQPAIEKILTYLEQQVDSFDLFSTDKPFMQIADMEHNTAPSSVAKLYIHRVTGQNHALFDHSLDKNPLPAKPSEIARLLITCHAFGVALGNTGDIYLYGKKLSRGNAKDGTCTRPLNIWLTGKTIIETILLNILPCEIGTPIWEQAEPFQKMDNISRKDPIPPDGICDLYTSMSRVVRLIPDENGHVKMIHYAQGRSLSKEIIDPMQISFNDPQKEGSKKQLAIPTGTAWAELTRILEPGANGIIDQARTLKNLPSNTSIQTAGLITEVGKGAKILQWNRDTIPYIGNILKNPEKEKEILTAIEYAIKKPYRSNQAYMLRITLEFYKRLTQDQPFGEEWQEIVQRTKLTC